MVNSRKGKSRNSPAKKSKPEIFIGSSTESLPIAQALELNLKHSFKITLWPMGVFEPGHNPLQDLERQLTKSVFGIFVFAKDDNSFVRGTKYTSTRDNVVLELGIFLGRLGSENCFIVAPHERTKMKIPSDLEGFALTTYDQERFEENARAALSPACSEIQGAIQRRIKERNTNQESTDVNLINMHIDQSLPLLQKSNSVSHHTIDLLSMLRRGQAGLEVSIKDESKLRTWSRSLMKMTLEELKLSMINLPDDAYIIWLKPTQDDPELLTHFEGENLPASYSSHYNFALGEGLAGTVWETGQAEIHSSLQIHPKWTIRAGCENISYVCVPVGKQGGTGGVLAFGSDTGFQTDLAQVEIMKVYASILALASS